MASPISFGGLASGLDTQAIIGALVAVEGRKVEFLRRDQDVLRKKVTAYDDLLGRLRKLQSAVEKLSDRRAFVAHAVSLSDGAATLLKATPNGSAAAGTYQVGISAIAQSTFLRSDGLADSGASLGLSGTLSIQVGSNVTNITVDASNDSLLGLKDAIRDSGAEVSATVVFDGVDYHLELRGKETGLANAVTILSEPPGASGPVLNLAQLRAAADAAFKIDGQDYTSANNSVTTAIGGVTLQLLDEQAPGAAPLQLTIAEDFASVQQQLKEFVDAYNEVSKFLREQAAPRATSSDSVKPLSGESALRSLRNAFGAIVSSQAALSSEYTSLASIGIRTTSDGTLKLDAAALGEALADDLDGMVSLFTDAAQGVGVRLLAAVKARTKPITGVVDLRKDALQDLSRSFDDRIRRAQESLDLYEEGLVRRYSQTEQLIGRLQSQGASLGAFATSLSGGRRR